MIIVRSPLRITLGGGGTDLPSYYKKRTGSLVAAAIDKYVYVAINKPFNDYYMIKYSAYEQVKSIDEIKHPIVREALKETGVLNDYLEIASFADIPAGTGLGSSGSFTTGLLKALYSYKKQPASPQLLFEQAYKIEAEKLGQAIGKQDQCIAATGGITSFEFLPDDSVVTEAVNLSAETINSLEDNLMLFFTGYSRSASSILKDQNDRSKSGDEEMIEWLDFTKELGRKSKAALKSGNLTEFGELMNEHWEGKKKRSGGMTNENIDKWYNMAIKNGAIGGKLVGAGGGGFLMFYAHDKDKLVSCMRDERLEELRFRFDFEGTKVLVG